MLVWGFGVRWGNEAGTLVFAGIWYGAGGALWGRLGTVWGNKKIGAWGVTLGRSRMGALGRRIRPPSNTLPLPSALCALKDLRCLGGLVTGVRCREVGSQ